MNSCNKVVVTLEIDKSFETHRKYGMSRGSKKEKTERTYENQKQ